MQTQGIHAVVGRGGPFTDGVRAAMGVRRAPACRAVAAEPWTRRGSRPGCWFCSRPSNCALMAVSLCVSHTSSFQVLEEKDLLVGRVERAGAGGCSPWGECEDAARELQGQELSSGSGVGSRGGVDFWMLRGWN